MPELPEVETIVRRLSRELPGHAIARASVLRDNVVRGPVRAFVSALQGPTIESVTRRGKFIVVRLSSGRVWLTHLRMSGKFQIVAGDGRGRSRVRGVADAPSRRRRRGPPGAGLPAYTRAVFDLEDGTRLLYVDPRTLGEMEIIPAGEWEARASRLGPEPLDPAFTPDVLTQRLAASRRTVKEFLLDQTKIAGLGNIYAAEALWRARVSPRRRASSMGPVRAHRLHRAIVEVLGEAIGKSGTSLGETYLDWADGEGAPGEFYDLLNAYDREGEPCPRCGAPIRRIVQGQRSTYYCPACQR